MSCPGCGEGPAFPARQRVDWALWVHPTLARVCLVPTAAPAGQVRFTECHDCHHGRQLQGTALAIRQRGGWHRLVTFTVAAPCPRCRGHARLPGFVMPA